MSAPSVVVIGNFDGVHRGHQAVLAQARRVADARSLVCTVLTFDPHPAEVLGRGAPPRLVSLARRTELLRAHGADAVVIEPFTLALAGFSPERFARDLLGKRLMARAVVVGENFRFGHKRAGTMQTLKDLGAELGFEAIAAEVAGDEEGPFSSTRIRDAIAAGDVARAAIVLGRPHALRGVVERGDQRGRTIGFPTANLGGVVEMLPAHGVYAVRVEAPGVFAGTREGVMNVGVRPTVDGASLRIEVHVLDFEGDLYGAELSVALVARLRGEQKFSGLDELRAQIARDVEAARKALGGETEPPESDT
ncbi:MAG: bifunctional riboflavin kinase/FAD synthetase [Labilithrix sp.]|nr:bifunctional riboflavin kinase/FAD synthetase [Labilithrix sp.]